MEEAAAAAGFSLNPSARSTSRLVLVSLFLLWGRLKDDDDDGVGIRVGGADDATRAAPSGDTSRIVSLFGIVFIFLAVKLDRSSSTAFLPYKVPFVIRSFS